ncbi:hypothetical protein Q7P37_000878 [Cladosporium fusiforme]
MSVDDGPNDTQIADWAPTPISTNFGAKEIGWQALGPAIGCSALATIVVTLRWYTRCRLTLCMGVDDFVILLSLILSWCMCAIIGAELNEGLGVYLGGRPVDAQHLAKLVIINNDLWALAVNTTKASILAQYLRIFSSRNTRICCYVLLVLLVPAVCWSIFDGTFLCRPVAKLWEPTIPGVCMDPRSYWLSAAGVNMGMDFMVLLLPLPAITQLRLPRKQKLCLVLMFVLGFIVCVVSVVRLATVYCFQKSGRLIESGIQAVTWSAVEVNIGIICASLIALKPLLVRFWPSLLDDTGVPEHCMRLPMVQTNDEEARNLRVVETPSTSSPISAVSPPSARSKSSGSTLRRSSAATTLPGMPQTEGLSFLSMLTGGTYFGTAATLSDLRNLADINPILFAPRQRLHGQLFILKNFDISVPAMESFEKHTRARDNNPRESTRLQTQHRVIIHAMGKQVLAPIDLSQPGLRILDSGGSDGYWLRELEKQYMSQHHTYVCSDVVPSLFPTNPPSNYQYVGQDIRQPWPISSHSSFDLVHQRLVLAGAGTIPLKEVIGHLVDVLKPGGWLQLGELDGREFEENGPANREFYALLRHVLRCVGKSGDLGAILRPAAEELGLVGVRDDVFVVCQGVLLDNVCDGLVEESIESACGAVGPLLAVNENLPMPFEGQRDLSTLEKRLRRELREEGGRSAFRVVWGQKAST